jgi:hypothetical protein
MTIFSFPSIVPSSNSFELVTNTKTFRSPLTNAVQTSTRKGSLWKASLAFNNLSGADRAEMQAFLAKLNGQEHRFYLQDHGFVRRGTGGGTISVRGAGQTGSTLEVDGASFSVTNFLKAGDYVAFNNEFHMVTADCDSNGLGYVSIPVAPPIRKPTNDNDLVDYNVPVLGVFMLASSAAWSTDANLYSNFSIEAVEDVLA